MVHSYGKPKRIYWKKVAGPFEKLDYIQTYDIVFDTYDMRIRQLGK